MFCDILMPDGTPSWADPRHVLRRALGKAADAGFTFYTHPEIEFFLLQGPSDRRPHAPSRSTPAATSTRRRTTSATTSAGDAITMLERMGISVEFSHHEVAPGQQEIDLRYADALTTADNIMTFRLVIKEVALEQGVYATFMPKPFADQPGSAMHTHLSLFEGDRNAFHDAGDPLGLSKVGKHFIAGPAQARRRDHRRHQPVGELLQAAVGRRRGAVVRLLGPQQPLRAGPGADVQAAEGQLDPRRVPLARLGLQPLPGLRGAARRPGSRASRRATSCPTGAEDDVWALTDAERRAMGIEPLPGSLSDAIRSWSAASSWPRRSASTSSTSSCATSAPSGRTTGARSRRSSSSATFRPL